MNPNGDPWQNPLEEYSKLAAILIYHNFKDSDFSRLYPSNFSQNAKTKLDPTKDALTQKMCRFGSGLLYPQPLAEPTRPP